MDPQLIQDYLRSNLGYETQLVSLSMPDQPHFVKSQFALYQANLYGHPIGFAVSRLEDFSKHDFIELVSAMTLLRERCACLPVLVLSHLSKQVRLALIRQKVSFLVPGTQMFLPYLGLDLSDRIPQATVEHRHVLRPVAQAMLIQYLLDGNLQHLTVNQSAKVLRLTAMGALRAANQMNALGLCEVRFNGFSKTLNFNENRRELWQAAQPYLQSPVRKRITVEDDRPLVDFPFSGEYALSRHTDLGERRKCYALPMNTANALLKSGAIRPAFPQETGMAELESWSYTLPGWTDEVDSFSLAIALKNHPDPRVRLALMQLEEQAQW